MAEATAVTLSIITINLNNKAGLQRTMNSIVSQTCKDYEWIVIDGGSTDGSRELIKRNEQHITYWVSEPDEGIYSAMNKGVDVAKGEYLQFLNSGDYLADNSVIGKFLALRPMADIIYGNAIYVNKDGKEEERFNAPELVRLSYFWQHSLCHQAMFYSRHCFENYRYNERYRIASDVESCMYLLYHGFSFVKWNEFVVRFETGGMSAIDKGGEEFADIVNRLLPPGVLADYGDFIQFRDVDLAIMIRGIMHSNKFVRHLTRVCLYPIYLGFCKR